MEQRNTRSGSIRIKVSPAMLAKIECEAEAFCMPVATLCAFAVADWVTRQETNRKLSRMAVLSAARQSSDQFAAGMTDERMEALFGPMIEAMGKAMGQGSGSFEPEGPKGSEG